MSDRVRIDDTEGDISRRDEDAFLATVRSEKHQRREFAEAFAREQSGPPSVEDLLTDHRNQGRKIADLDRVVRRLRRSLLVSNLVSGTVALAMLLLAGYFYFDPAGGLHLFGENKSDADSARRLQAPRNAAAPFVLESDLDFRIRTDVDRKYQLIARELYNRVRSFRRPRGSIDERNAATEDYVNFLTDVSQVIEQAKTEQPSREIVLALANLAMVGQELRRVQRIEDLRVETRDKLDQIAAILRAPDARYPDLE